MPLASLVALLSTTAALAQEPPGCTLLDGLLQCSPGVSIAPLPRIPIVQSDGRQRVASPLAGHSPGGAAAAVVLEGRPQEGAWLKAIVSSAELESLQAGAYHWYHRPPGRLRWELIPVASGPSYQLQRGDMAYDVMVLVVLPRPDGSQRVLSNPVGPVMALGASSP